MSRRVLAALWAGLLLCPGIGWTESIVFQSTDTPPIWSPALPDGGLGGSLLRLVSEAAGVSYTTEYLPVKRFRSSRAPYIVGDPDILEDTRGRAIFPIGVFHSAFFFHQPHQPPQRFANMEAMRGHVLGVLRGTLEDKAAFEAAGVRVEESDSMASLVRKLERGRLDVAIMVTASGLHVIRELFPLRTQEFANVDIPGTERPITIMIATGDAEGQEVARHYRRALEMSLSSKPYHALLQRFYGKGVMPASSDELKKFIKFYADTWEE